MARGYLQRRLEETLKIANLISASHLASVRLRCARLTKQTVLKGHRAKIFEIFRSRIDNADLNFTLDTPGGFSLKNSERVLRDNHAFN
jgi:hypothetical protein